MKPRKVPKPEPRRRLRCNNKWPIWILKDTNQSMGKILQHSIKCTWTTFNSLTVTLFQIITQHNRSHPKYLKDHTVSKAHSMELMQMIDKTTITNRKVQIPNQSQRVTRLWSISLHVNSLNFQHIWEGSTETNSSMKVLILSNRTDKSYMLMEESRDLFKCWVTCNLLMVNLWMVSLTSAQLTWLYKICNAESRRCNFVS